LQHSNSVAYQVTTSQLITNLPNGFYSLTAYSKCSGGQKACYLAGNDRLTSLPRFTRTGRQSSCGYQRYQRPVRGPDLFRCVRQQLVRVDEVNLVKDDIAYTFLKGGDISDAHLRRARRWQVLRNQWGPDGLPADPDQPRIQYRRLRPTTIRETPITHPRSFYRRAFQSPTNILNLAARAKVQGLQLELTFYYSDYWTNGKPHDWVGSPSPVDQCRL